ncbi:hypothetical protein D3C78_1527760 [compost metagenome]
MHELAVFVGLLDVERLVRFDVGEADRQRADLRPHAGVQQMGRGDHATDFVAVRDGVDQHVRAGYAGFEAVDVRDAGVAFPVGREVAGQDFKGGGVGFESGILHGMGPIRGGCRRGRSSLYTAPGVRSSWW